MKKITSMHAVKWLLRIGVSFSFIYPPISAFFNPYAWVGYFPPFFSALPIEATLRLHVFGVIEVVIALWILFGRKIAVPALFAAAMLAGIVLFNLSQMDVLFRDIPIILMALALIILEKNK
jgi:uncharacterized membrane protein YphA (DoxX/SURF4 family)